MSYVLLPWCEHIPWKMQSILQGAFLGPDKGNVPAIKSVQRWLRTVSQNNADPSKEYMKEAATPGALALCEELEYCSCHYTHHLADALRVLAVYHPDGIVRVRAYEYHYRIAEELFHFVPETAAQFIDRHRDKTVHD